ncbi:MAG TPA: GTP 3',8-cyclase MoaA [Thermoanaerobaculia bacterium]|nr:GTP 3',8-cyclase MoaA [Thermoanaerobaculia bacterium]
MDAARCMPRDRLGRPLTDLRLSVTDRCNFRCSFCMPAEHEHHFLPRAEVLDYEEIARLVGVFTRLGVRKVRITGGEPLLRRDLERLVALLAAQPEIDDLALTTNGHLLAQKAPALAAAGLRRVTVSLHSLDQQTFGSLTGGKGSVARVLEGIDAALAAGLTPVKVNAVVVRGVNDHEVVPLARRFKRPGVVLRFIEYMDVGTVNDWDPAAVVPAREILDRLSAELPVEAVGRRRAEEPASRYRYRDGEGEIGVIASVSDPFCGDCSRARLTAEGRLYTCLFAALGHDLKAPLRAGASDDELEARIAAIWGRRQDRYSEERARLLAAGESPRPTGRVEMYRIGG